MTERSYRPNSEGRLEANGRPSQYRARHLPRGLPEPGDRGSVTRFVGIEMRQTVRGLGRALNVLPQDFAVMQTQHVGPDGCR